MQSNSSKTSAVSKYVDTPIGVLELEAHGSFLTKVKWPSGCKKAPISTFSCDPVLDLATRELIAYFSGTLEQWSTPLKPDGTSFQKEVWNSLTAVGFGQITTYGNLAKFLGRPGASRAVGTALGKNPIPILIPCHRVCRSSGANTCFSGGTERKKFLLDLECKKVA